MLSAHPLSGGYGDPPSLPAPMTGGGLLRRISWAQRRQLAWGMTAGVVWMSAITLVPVALGRAIDGGIRTASWPTFAAWTGALFLLYAMDAGTWVLRHRVAVGIWARSLAWLHELIVARTLDPRASPTGTVAPGDAVSLVASDSRRVGNALDTSCRGAGSVVTSVAVIAAMVAFRWEVAVAVAGVLLPLLLLLARCLHRLERRSYRQQRALSDAGAIAADIISALRVVKGVGAEALVIERYSSRAGEIMKTSLAAAGMRATTYGLDLAMSGAVIGVVAWLGGRLVLAGHLTVGELVMFSGWSVFLVMPLLIFNEWGRKLAMGSAAAHRIAAALTISEAGMPDCGGTVTLDPVRGTVCFERVSLAGAAGVPTLSDVDMDIAAGAFIGIVAPAASGDGIAALLATTAVPSAGRVMLDGVSLGDLAPASLRVALVVAEHDATLFRGSLRDNLAIAAPDADESAMRGALAAAAAADVVEGLGGGLDGPVSERGRSLSGGQRQRIALARALLADPAVLVLVDPTSAVDSFTEAVIIDRLTAARAGKTTIVITSSPAILDVADDVMFVGPVGSGNRIGLVDRGSHQHLLASRPPYRAQFVDEPTPELART